MVTKSPSAPPAAGPPEPDAAQSIEAAEMFVRALIAHDVDCLFLNPGTDTFPIQEALSKLEQRGERVPRTVLCLFELVALAAAHGYYVATGRPQAVLVHVDVGTQNLGGMLHNVQRGRAAVLICAGRTPYTSDPRQRGTRDTYIHWLQEQFDQHGIVRNFVKWEYELRRPDQMAEAVSRALQIARSDPPGPVYLTLPREVLMSELDASQAAAAIVVPAAARTGAGDPDALKEVAARLVRSVQPMVVTATTGRTREGFSALVRLAELLALPVVERRERVNFPTSHPLHQGFDPGPLLETADLVLVLDCDIPYIPSRQMPRRDAAVIQIDLDPVKERIPLWNFPLSLAVRADTSRALHLIADAAAALLDDEGRTRIERRRAELTVRHDRQVDARAAALRLETEAPIAVEWLGHCLAQLHREAPDCIVVDETVTSYPVLWKYLDLEEPGSIFGSGGSSLGWGLGAALGVKLAVPDRPVVVTVGDGSFVFGEPLAALWASQVNRAPLLVVIFNNSCYNATKTPLRQAYPDGYSVRGDRYVGVDLLPAPRHDLLAPVIGAVGERVEDPRDVLPALRRGLEHVRAGRTAILDVILARP